MKLHLIAIVVAALSLSSCGTTKNTTVMDTKEDAITDVNWVLEELDGQKFADFNNLEKEVGFKLSAKGQKVTGFSGCNTFMAVYNVAEGNRMRFDAIGSTRMACPSENFNESEFLSKLGMVDAYAIVDDKLVLKQGEQTIAVFKKADGSHFYVPEIVNKKWKLKTLEGKDVSNDEENEIFFELDSNEGRVHGFAGCNTFNGLYVLEKGMRIRFNQVATTMMACPEGEVKERDVMNVFNLANNYTIDGNTLSLNVGRRAPLAVFIAE